MWHPVASRSILLGLLFLLVTVSGCPPPQQRWVTRTGSNLGLLNPADEDLHASRVRLAELRQVREAAGFGRDYRVGATDMLKVSVFDVNEMERSVRVSGVGSIMLPLIGSVKAAGATERDLETEIAARLGEKFVQDPQVTVQVIEYNSQRVAVVGAVERPGQYSLTKDKNTILDMLSEAGGLARDAGSRIYLLPGERIGLEQSNNLNAAAQLAASGASVIEQQARIDGDPIVVDVHDLLDASTQSALMLPARAGDVVVVPEGGQFLVDGWVEKPGAYDITRGLTVLGALTAAGGPLYPAATRDVQVVRTQRNGVRMVLNADVPTIIEGKGRDIPLEAGDVVYVPASAAKLPLYTLYNFVTNVFRVAGTIPVL
jgi:polysaccharide export outer membrane protein